MFASLLCAQRVSLRPLLLRARDTHPAAWSAGTVGSPRRRQTRNPYRCFASAAVVAAGVRGMRSRRANPSQEPSAAAQGANDVGSSVLPVDRAGKGSECLFFVHGWPDDKMLWKAQVKHFQDKYRCVRVTMPHFAGREDSEVWRPEGYDFKDAAQLLANTIRQEESERPVVLVIHDWGCIWGFLTQQAYPELVKAVVAMDVGHPSEFAPGCGLVPKVVGYGLAYQYWLMVAYLLRRATRDTCIDASGRAVSDWMARAFARLCKKGLDDETDADLQSGRITADACYPYFYFHRNFGVRPFPGVGASLEGDRPSCPCLFLYASRKPFSFHTAAWEEHLRSRSDCDVMAVPAQHWLQVECPAAVNEAMEVWLNRTLPAANSNT